MSNNSSTKNEKSSIALFVKEIGRDFIYVD